jgi:hypothetical protein
MLLNVLHKGRNSIKKRFDSKRARPKPYTIGDLVVVRIASIVTKGESKKLLAKWQGPFKVTK